MIAIENVFEYVSQYIIKSGEQLDTDNYTRITSSVVEVGIVKWTARTFRKVGTLTLSLTAHLQEDNQTPDMPLLKWTLGKRAIIEDDLQAFEWINMGWIMKEMRFERDGRTIERVHYRMGYRLFVYLQNKIDQEQQERIRQFASYQLEAQKVLKDLVSNNREREAILSLLTHHVSVSMYWKVEELAGSDLLPLSWSTVKKIKFLLFLLAFIMISSCKAAFDWKEIGAQYYGGIGGSKAFDDYKDEFISSLEEWSGQSAEILGLISPGKITPLYFAGHLSGHWSCYQAGPVHALTDLSIAQDQYSTDATTLWLVENRGILTRLAAERDFLRETGSLIVCVDGHLRSSHKRFIHNSLINSHIRQVIFWSDYDEDGLLIAGEMAEVVSAYPLTLKWICHDHKVMKDWSNYQQYMRALLQEVRLEQELILGEAEIWRQWINH
ncbi:hypothetical protein Back11_38440 [Paenibacillus baekrokdamisoli]|uniref:DUF2399 domain-containing protein n=1 Tax=Paenibacillus baekrokdamisoli TaxID=1712516 RepID=A0A3G9JHK5_9BACL|nr:DUF2399 domain-containing protein [Paenibacillus baekrokdamisoli]BBH22499.1 hypothetical protein Back11_38440 [Paenibacillus baekrokdamisoli]